MTRPVLFVSGFGRCGTSLTLQMLSAGGVPCAGEWPAFEDERCKFGPISPAFLEEHAGHAVKRLDPQKSSLPAGFGHLTIWLDRDPVQQAASQVKFMRIYAGMPPPPRRVQKLHVKGLVKDRKEAMRSIGRGALDKPLILAFEDIIANPAGAALSIARLLDNRDFSPLDLDAMAKVVVRRGPECLPDINLELLQLAEAEEGRL